MKTKIKIKLVLCSLSPLLTYSPLSKVYFYSFEMIEILFKVQSKNMLRRAMRAQQKLQSACFPQQEEENLSYVKAKKKNHTHKHTHTQHTHTTQKHKETYV